MGKTILVVLVLAAAGAGVYFFILKPDEGEKLVLKAKGYTKAETPEDLMEKVKKAVDNREYNGLANYLSGDYKVQVEKAADKAETLGKAIDNLKSAMEKYGVKSDKVELLLYFLDPFPKGLQTTVESKADDSASVTLKVAATTVKLTAWPELKEDKNMFNIIQRNIAQPQQKAKKEDKGWVLDIPMHSKYPDFVANFNAKATNFANALDEIREKLRTDSTIKTKGGLEDLVKKRINDASE